MAGNPLVDQGFLNRVKGSVVLTNFPALTVTASFLGREGINFRLDGDITQQLPTLTGAVNSPEPYSPVEIMIALLKTQSLAEAYKTQMEANSQLGPGTVYPDVQAGGISQYQVQNLMIARVGELTFNGSTPLFGVYLRGFYILNNSLFD